MSLRVLVQHAVPDPRIKCVMHFPLGLHCCPGDAGGASWASTVQGLFTLRRRAHRVTRSPSRAWLHEIGLSSTLLFSDACPGSL